MATWLAFPFAVFPAGIAIALSVGADPTVALVAGLITFGVVFAMNSAVHSYLILAYSDGDKVAMNLGFYYMANAGGRLIGTILSGALYQWQGLQASVAFVLVAGLLARLLPERPSPSSPTCFGGSLDRLRSQGVMPLPGLDSFKRNDRRRPARSWPRRRSASSLTPYVCYGSGPPKRSRLTVLPTGAR